MQSIFCGAPHRAVNVSTGADIASGKALVRSNGDWGISTLRNARCTRARSSYDPLASISAGFGVDASPHAAFLKPSGRALRLPPRFNSLNSL